MRRLDNQKTQLQGFRAMAIFFQIFCFSLPMFWSNAALASCNEGPSAGVDWADCRKRNLILSGKDFTRSKFVETDFTLTDLSNATLDGSDFTKANITRSNINNVSAKDANFTKVVGNRTSMSGAVLENVSFEKAEMPRTDFMQAQISNASFSRAEIGRANFSDANLFNVDFSFANLARADFRSATLSGVLNFEGAYLFRARLEGLDISSFVGLSQWQIDIACGDEKTGLPTGLERPGHWPCVEEED